MELPPNGPNSGIRKIRYRVKAKNVSYKRSLQQNEYYNWLPWKKSESSFILRNVHCEARPGEITAIAGPSGAGKTTLLEILAGIIPLSRVSGEVLVNEQPINARCFRRLSGYVTQDEALFPLLTVEETLMYSARLRLPGMLRIAADRVKELVKELGLEHVAYTRIGSESRRGISGGEKRRVSIGNDLVHDPAVLLIDEPTSGLDSGFQILELFDQILLLSNGTVLHQGSLHLLEQTLRLTGHSIPKHVNVLELAIEATDSLITRDLQRKMTLKD